MIEEVMKKWHLHIQGNLAGGLDELLADDVEFYSPIVFTAQKGKDLTKMYLAAAGNTFSGGAEEKKDGAALSNFRYAKEVLSGNHAVLEFESEVD